MHHSMHAVPCMTYKGAFPDLPFQSVIFSMHVPLNDQSLKHVSIVTKSETLGGKTKAYIRLRNEWYTCMV